MKQADKYRILIRNFSPSALCLLIIVLCRFFPGLGITRQVPEGIFWAGLVAGFMPTLFSGRFYLLAIKKETTGLKIEYADRLGSVHSTAIPLEKINTVQLKEKKGLARPYALLLLQGPELNKEYYLFNESLREEITALQREFPSA